MTISTDVVHMWDIIIIVGFLSINDQSFKHLLMAITTKKTKLLKDAQKHLLVHITEKNQGYEDA